ncbi:MAG: hypothetical protein IJK28_02050 [Clostridia bacterium]|nr:hypothetical protein [Clostridia bacterium]
MRELTPAEAVGRALVKRFRKTLWQPFVAACKRYDLTRGGDRIAAILDGSSEALCAAMLLRELERHSEVPFRLRICLSPGVTDSDGAAERLGIAPEAYGEVMADCNVRVGTACMSEVCETLLAGMLCEGRLHAVLPREEDGERTVIRPLYCVERRDIRAWCRYHGLPWTPAPMPPERERMRVLLDSLRAGHPNAEISLFRAAHAVHADTFPREIG